MKAGLLTNAAIVRPLHAFCCLLMSLLSTTSAEAACGDGAIRVCNRSSDPLSFAHAQEYCGVVNFICRSGTVHVEGWQWLEPGACQKVPMHNGNRWWAAVFLLRSHSKAGITQPSYPIDTRISEGNRAGVSGYDPGQGWYLPESGQFTFEFGESTGNIRDYTHTLYPQGQKYFASAIVRTDCFTVRTLELE